MKKEGMDIALKAKYPDMKIGAPFITKPEIIVNPVMIGDKKFILKRFKTTETFDGEKIGVEEEKSTRAWSDYTPFAAKVKDSAQANKIYEILYEYGGISLTELSEKVVSGYDLTEEEKGYPFKALLAGDVARIMSNLSSGFEVGHKMGRIHSNIRPDNIVYDGKIAKIISIGNSFETSKSFSIHSTYLVGEQDELMAYATNRYLPPEMIIDPKCDKVYASLDTYCFGLSFYQILLRKTDVQLDKEVKEWRSKEDTHDNVIKELQKIRLLKDLNGEIRSKIIEILTACLSFEARKRISFATMRLVLEEMMEKPGTFQENQKALFSTTSASVTEEEINFYSLEEGTTISRYDAFLIAQRINTNPKLKKIIIFKAQLDDYGGEIIMKALIHNKSIHTLNLCTFA